jgi:hypothetical protein
MEYIVKTRSKKTKQFIETIMPSIIKQLKLENSRKFVLIDIGNHSGEGNAGMTMPLDAVDSYIVSIRPGRLSDIGATLAHEMVHVKQLAKGVLRTNGNIKYWCGRRYSNKVKYLDQPWEQEAFAKQEIILRRALGQ